MTTKNLLVELFVEELPPKALKKLGDAFAGVLHEQLKAQGLCDGDSVLTAFASPRRLAAHITRVAGQGADKAVSQKLMPVAVGLDTAGNASPALLKKLQALGADACAVANLKRVMDGKAEALFYESTQQGATLVDALNAALATAIAKLPIPKVMSYQLDAGSAMPGWTSVSFVRPAHGLVALHGSTVVPVEALGLKAGNSTQGHRFLSKGVIAIQQADSYEQQLREEGKVIAGFIERRETIEKKLEALRVSTESEGIIRPNDLLDEVTALVEWPVVYECHFDREFLGVPEECLILTMQTNQKYFPCTLGGALTNRFLVVSNIATVDPSAIISGNERVIRPRLADAQFFFNQDRKKTLESRVDGLSRVVYHNKLGSQYERMQRVCAIAEAIAQQIGDKTLVENTVMAARLAKTDLLTDMVGEFPELQGVMGWYYARLEKLPYEVALAVADHYKPRFAGDELPRNQVGLVVALADKLETLVGMFGIGNLPTGDKDPFALRRHALGVVRMLSEPWNQPIPGGLQIELQKLISIAVRVFGDLITDPSAALTDFIYERVKSYFKDILQEFQNITGVSETSFSSIDVEAVLALRPKLLRNVKRQSDAVSEFRRLPEAPALAAANKRVGNILKKAEGAVEAKVNTALLQVEEEKALHIAINAIAAKADKAWADGDYTANLQALAALKDPVDAFFDKVMVNAEDPALKANRLGLLATLHQAMNRVADLSKLAS